MKTDLDPRDVDAALHTAAGSLHEAVADLPLNGPPTASATRSPIALGAVLLIVAALTTAAVGATRGGDDGIDVAADPVSDLQGLVADPAPDGLALAWAGEQTSARVDGSGVNADTQAGVGAQTLGLDTYLYGNASAEASASPFATSDLVANVWDASEVSAEAGEAAQISALDGLANTTSANVRGHAASICAAPDCVADATSDVTTVWWHEAETLEVVLASRTLTVAQILAIAEELVVDADGALTLGALPGGLPGPLDELGKLHDTAVASTRDAVANWVGYVDPADPTGRFVDITTMAGDSAELMALVWELGAQTVVQVRGQDGWLWAGAGAQAQAGDTTATAVGTVQLLWQESPGVIVHVTSLGVDQDELLDLAAGLQTASDGEWTDIMASVSADADETAGAAAEAAANGDASAHVDAGSGAGVDADVAAGADGVDAQVGAGAGGAGTGAGVDAEVSVDEGVVDIAVSLHADLGTEAVIGAVTNTVNQVGGAVNQAGQELDESVGQLVPQD